MTYSRRSIPWFTMEQFDEVSIDRFTSRLAEMVDTHVMLPASVAAWNAYAELLLAARRNPHAELANVPNIRDMLDQLVLVRAACDSRGYGLLRRYEFVPGPDARAALWLVPVTDDRCYGCGMTPDACTCDVPAFDAVPAFPIKGEHYTFDDDGFGITIRRREDGASVYIQAADERAVIERGIMAMQQIGHDEAMIADTIGGEYDHLMDD